MRFVKLFFVVLLISAFAVSCKPQKDMTLKDFAKIEFEINLPNPEVDKQLVENVVKKYGYTYKQFKDLYEKVEKDPKLREKLGDIRLKEQQSEMK